MSLLNCFVLLVTCPIKQSLSIPRVKSSPVLFSPFVVGRGGSAAGRLRGGTNKHIPKTHHTNTEWMLSQLCLRQQRAQVLSSALTEAGKYVSIIFTLTQSHGIKPNALLSLSVGFKTPQLVDRNKKLKKVTKGFKKMFKNELSIDIYICVYIHVYFFY